MTNPNRFYRNEITLGGTILETQTTDPTGLSESAKDYIQVNSLSDLIGFNPKNLSPSRTPKSLKLALGENPFLEAQVKDKYDRWQTALLATPKQVMLIANYYAMRRVPKAQLFVRAVGVIGLERILKPKSFNAKATINKIIAARTPKLKDSHIYTSKSISLHGVTLDAYSNQVLDSRGNYQYYLSVRGLADTVGVTHTILVGKLLPKSLKAILPEGWMGYNLAVKNSKGAAIKINGWDLPSCMIFWQYYALRGNKKAQQILKSLTLIGLISLVDEVYGRAPELTQSKLMRILDTPRTWEATFSKGFCSKVSSWFPYNYRKRAAFYWEHLYCFMNDDELIRLEESNPIIPGKGRRSCVHSCIDEDVLERLKPVIHAVESMVMGSDNFEDFQTLYELKYGSV